MEMLKDTNRVAKLYGFIHANDERHPEQNPLLRWSEYSTIEEDNLAIESRMANMPIVHRHTQRNGSWKTADFSVNSPIMRELLTRALDKYQDLDMALENWTFKPPYMPLVHRWNQLRDICTQKYSDGMGESQETLAAKALLEFLGPILGPSVDALAKTHDTGGVGYEDIWQIFPPGELVVLQLYGVDLIGRVVKYSRPRETRMWNIFLEYVDWNGNSCGYADTKMVIQPYQDLRHVTSLPSWPLSFHQDSKGLRGRLIDRGRRFERLRGFHLQNYTGRSIFQGKGRMISGRVIIDAFACRGDMKSYKPSFRPLTGLESSDKPAELNRESQISHDRPHLSLEPVLRPPPLSTHPPAAALSEQVRLLQQRAILMHGSLPGKPRGGALNVKDTCVNVAAGPRQPPMPPPSFQQPARVIRKTRRRDYSPSSSSSRSRSGSASSSDSIFLIEGPDFKPVPISEALGRKEDLTALSDEECLLTTPWLVGFDLKTKEWGRFNVDNLEDIVWNYDAFDSLVLPNDEKELAWSFVESKRTSVDTFDDFIPDKGRGIIILMFGPPGVGKTFTAEAVAERANVPLYSISAGALGTEPQEVEKNLTRALERCKVWNAMLLLDEADVFLSARSHNTIAGNELVSVFLTKLEYYPGILFLTTNRVSDIDFAFQSRVDLLLPYHELTPQARRKIWENFMDRAGRDRFDFRDADLDKLSQMSLNGREIKNLVKTSQWLSRKTGGLVSMDTLYTLAEKRVGALRLLAESSI